MELQWRSNRDHNEPHAGHQGFTATTDNATYRITATPDHRYAWCLTIDPTVPVQEALPNQLAGRVVFRTDDVADLYTTAQTTENGLCSDADASTI